MLHGVTELDAVVGEKRVHAMGNRLKQSLEEANRNTDVGQPDGMRVRGAVVSTWHIADLSNRDQLNRFHHTTGPDN